MNARYSSTVIAASASDHKQAALFFDNVLPLHSYSTVPREVRADLTVSATDASEEEFIREFSALIELPEDSICVPSGIERYLTDYDPDARDALHIYQHLVQGKSGVDALRTLTELTNTPSIANSVVSNLKKVTSFYRNVYAYNLARLCTKRCNIAMVPFLTTRWGLDKAFSSGEVEVIEVCLAGASVVDTSAASWEQILELRKDAEAKSKLRNLRLWLHENYSGKSPDFIHDTLSRKLSEYESACRKHGFDMVSSMITSLADSKSVLGALAVTALAILTHNLSAASAAAISGAVIEISNMAVLVAKKRSAYRAFKNEHELAYIVEAKRRINA